MLGVALLPTTIVAQPGTLKDQLVGTWALVSFGRTLNFVNLVPIGHKVACRPFSSSASAALTTCFIERMYQIP
jgi:hypothetical protein